ncbi:photosystem II reaction center W protein, chloroplastic [Curcuma longa]|uniref:photosystem II reaction center W protein, chloroplastic n=1 Tax=Curcuma longa TaxID=136217 RepID=UPI003D9EA2EF
MATVVAAAAPASTFAHRTVLPRQSATGSPSALGLPQLACKGGRSVRCSMEAKSRAVATTSTAAAVMAMAASASPVLALVDDRMSTEGTGLSLGISNNLLGWILFGVFGLIWALYFVYTSTLEEDEDSALSL